MNQKSQNPADDYALVVQPAFFVGHIGEQDQKRQYDSGFRCDGYDQMKAVRMAEDAAMNKCYSSGIPYCQIKHSMIVINGHLGYQDGFDGYLGYGSGLPQVCPQS